MHSARKAGKDFRSCGEEVSIAREGLVQGLHKADARSIPTNVGT